MKTLTVRFLPEEERSTEELTALVQSICRGRTTTFEVEFVYARLFIINIEDDAEQLVNDFLDTPGVMRAYITPIRSQ